MIRIGTRKSPLALRQAQEVRDLLLDHEVEIVPFVTRGDRIQDHVLSEVGGKGVFIKEIEEALLRGEIEIGVHSLKDLPSCLEEGLEIGGFLERKDPRDAWFSRDHEDLLTIGSGSVVGTASLRRQTQVLAYRPDLRVAPLRGNVGTRLRKLEEGEVDAIILAVAGIERLNVSRRPDRIFAPEFFVPAVGQGALGLEIRSDDSEMAEVIRSISCAETTACVTVERAFLLALEGSCRMPIGGLAVSRQGTLYFRGLAARGEKILRIERSGTAEEAYSLGYEAGLAMRERGEWA